MSAHSWRFAVLALTGAFAVSAQPSPVADSSAPVATEQPAAQPAPPVDTTAIAPKAPDSAAPLDTASPPLAVKDSATRLDASAATSLAKPGPLAFATDSTVGRTRSLKSDPLASVRYRSPRKAFFYSLMLPGAGQAYVGHWARGAAYITLDAGMALGWWYYGIHKSDLKMTQARDYADAHWKQSKYESQYKGLYDGSDKDTSTVKNVLKTINPSRESYCGSVYGTGNVTYAACAEILPDSSVNNSYNLHWEASQFDLNTSAAANSQHRAAFANSETFYSLVGQENEFVRGWDDVRLTDAEVSASGGLYATIKADYYDKLTDGNVDTKPISNPFGTSTAQGLYMSMRQKSNDYAKMKTWFLGGIILNHLISAVDAAFLAQSSNRSLYDMESRWYDGIQLWGGLAWTGTPTTQAMAWIRF